MITNRQFITDEEIDKALDYLRDNADEAAKARAERHYVTEYLKVVKAQLMKEHDTKSAVIQEREAFADPRYVAHLGVISTAIERDEKCRFMLSAAEAKIEAWRTQSSNERANKL